MKCKKIQNFCQENFSLFWPTNLWPSSNLDLKPFDYTIWGILENKTNATYYQNISSFNGRE